MSRVSAYGTQPSSQSPAESEPTSALLVPRSSLPTPFQKALSEISATTTPAGLKRTEVPAPRAAAPYAVALCAQLEEQGADGRFILLYDPASRPGWNGSFRVVCYLRTRLEDDLAWDELLPDVAFQWLTEALEQEGARVSGLGGHAIREQRTSFGTISDEERLQELELKFSWSPQGHLAAHIHAWQRALLSLAGQADGAESR